MTGVLAVCTILLGTLGVNSLLRLRFVHALPAVVLAITSSLYLAYIVGLLHPAWWLVVALCTAAGVLGFSVRVRQQSLKAALHPSPALVSFLIAMAFVAYFTAGRHVAGHDELRLWGAYPKLLFFDGKLLVGPDSLLMGEMQTYTPGLPLFGYFTAAFSPTFRDEPLFWASGLFVMSLLAPLATRVSWQRPAGIAAAGIGMALLPLAYANYLAEAGADFYASIFSDPVVGVVLGYLLWFATTDIERPRLWCAQFGLALGGLYLVKTSGLGLGLIVLVLALARWYLASRGETWRSRLTGVGLLIAPLAIAATTWMVIQARFGPPSKFDSGGLVPTLDGSIARGYAGMLIQRPEFGPGMGMFQPYSSFVILNAALFVVLGYLVIAHRGGRGKVIGAAVLTLLVCQCVFIAGIYVLIVGPFDGQYLSIPRYTATMLTAASVLLVLIATTHSFVRSGRWETWTSPLAVFGVAFLLLSFPLRIPITYVGGWEALTAVQSERLTAALEDVDFPEQHPIVSLMFPPDSLDAIGHHHGVYYQLLGTGVRVEISQPTVEVAPGVDDSDTSPGREDRTPLHIELFRRYILDNDVRFVVVAEENPELVDQYSDWFDRPPTVNNVYRVETEGEQVRFVSVP